LQPGRPQDCGDTNPNICRMYSQRFGAWRHAQGEKRCGRSTMRGRPPPTTVCLAQEPHQHFFVPWLE
jgi:hypothetical protein